MKKLKKLNEAKITKMKWNNDFLWCFTPSMILQDILACRDYTIIIYSTGRQLSWHIVYVRHWYVSVRIYKIASEPIENWFRPRTYVERVWGKVCVRKTTACSCGEEGKLTNNIPTHNSLLENWNRVPINFYCQNY